MKFFQRYGLAFLHDVVMIPIAWLSAYALSFNLSLPSHQLLQAGLATPLIMGIQSSVFAYFALHRGVWRFISVPDLLRIIKACFVGTVVSSGLIFLAFPQLHIPYSIFVLYALLLFLLLTTPRFVYRWRKEQPLSFRSSLPVLIIGAGRAGEMLVRDLLRDHTHCYSPVAFIDDDLNKVGRDIHRIPIVGNREQIPSLVQRLNIQLILIAIPSATSEQMRALVKICEDSQVSCRTLPRLQDLLSCDVTHNQLREVSIEDLLGREAVSLNWSQIQQGLAGKIILISGGGGSIGAELCRQVARIQPSKLVILENNEFNLYTIDLELREQFPELQLHSCLCDITDSAAVNYFLQQHRPHVIFHAAAYKHVPLLQNQIRPACVNNVIGTRVLAQAAITHQCQTFILISTDKAVNPNNIMGLTKRVAEIYCQQLNRQTPTRFITVRFGNVLDSAGSVVPLFRKQIQANKAVTVTHPKISRYFMTITEATQLILQTAIMGQGGEIFVLDMGKPVEIRYLAEQMIRLAGKVPDQDIKIVYTGLRPGEKLFEELFYQQEDLTKTPCKKILLTQQALGDHDIDKRIEQIEHACQRYDEAQLATLLAELPLN